METRIEITRRQDTGILHCVQNDKLRIAEGLLFQGVGGGGHELEAVPVEADGWVIEVVVAGVDVEREASEDGHGQAGGEAGGVGAEVVPGWEEAR